MSGKMEVWLLDLGTLYAKQEGIICRGRPQDTSRIHCQSWPFWSATAAGFCCSTLAAGLTR